ncbi:conserved hypothetical protein [Aspergillus terreus NIH2624]|uniref:DUF726 domain protein n=1 Tax=Aspergillus terreus (strain NIH 2624 / FGSC A1156) TaxID=341663 RepID=Q0CR50_ASPTN|nr:uncharacterized protein ATEG_03834 [Aspergillus terreus NIH2624]EAU35636.1 conserved hypothetical protein [Aspergillus terreus NIH2624]
MTSASSTPVHHPSADHSQPADSHASGNARPATTTAAARNSADDNDHDATSQKENISPLGGDAATKADADRDTGHKQGGAEDVDDFGLPIRARPKPPRSTGEASEDQELFHDVEETVSSNAAASKGSERESDNALESAPKTSKEDQSTTEDLSEQGAQSSTPMTTESDTAQDKKAMGSMDAEKPAPPSDVPPAGENGSPPPYTEKAQSETSGASVQHHPKHKKRASLKPSEWSHQRLNAPQESEDEAEEESEDEWREMPALDEFDVYDDYGRLIARGAKTEDNEAVYNGLGGAGRGYTRVQLDDDAESVNSLDEDTSYLFKESAANAAGIEDEELRDATSQLQATKDLLTESQRIAYVGVARLSIYQMTRDIERAPQTRGTRKARQKCIDSTRKWGQGMMARIYSHMEIDAAEQVMIEQLAEHGVEPSDLVRPLMQNARVQNPLANEEEDAPKESISTTASPSSKDAGRGSLSTDLDRSSMSSAPPPYDMHEGEDLPEVKTPSQMPTSAKIDIDLRWTVLCDLFLVLIADSSYDSRSRTLLERVGKSMEVPWLQIARFEKRVIDALEMQEAAEKETWDESDNMEKRRKLALKRKYMIMGIATVGGGLVIGLSAGLLAPVIGAGLAAGLTTVGISGTGAFLGGAGGTALIASGATLTGSTIGLKASHRRMGAVQTFEYRPLHNNKRVNLIVTVSGWMTGKVDDVRLPFSTVDPIMGDLYSVLWEPEMLRSMGDTIKILGTEALTQGLQQILGSTVLVALMASLQLPLVLSKLSYLIDNPWNVSLTRANAAGLILADSLMAHNLGKRPVTLLGFSLGARVIFSCLKELADKGAHGLIQNVYLFGSPIVANKDEYLKARSVVSGRFVNGYSSNDWILGYLFRATSGGIMRVAGLAKVEGVPGIENFDVTKLVNGHMDYRAAMPRLLKEVGWEVLSEEFAEIEDPDPDNHGERQRELIREIEEARREAEAKPDKKRFGLFKRGKLAQKKGWETYDVDRNSPIPRSPSENDGAGSVLFDIDAIKAELASESIEVKQLESTLPPMKLDLNPSPSPTSSASSPAVDKHAPKADASTSRPSAESTPGHKSQDIPSSVPPEEQIELSFDTTYHEPPQRTQSSFEPSTAAELDPHGSRPPLRSSMTMPVGVGASALGAMALEPNAWADHDFGNGDEGEIQMSFE